MKPFISRSGWELSAVWLTCLILFPAVSLLGGEFETGRARNWHQWRGPEANGSAPLADPPVTWGEESNLKWKVAIPGHGKSVPIVWEHRIFLITAVNTGTVRSEVAAPEDQPDRPFGIKYPNTVYRFVVLCLDRQTGKVLWEQTAVEDLPHEGHHGDNSFASASPVTDGKYLYVCFGSRGLYCYDLGGRLQWKRDLENVPTRLSFGEASSPVLHGDSLILVRDNERQSTILVLDARTGSTRWQADRDEISAWATPVVTEYEGRTQVITNASNRVRSYDLATGEILWQCGGQVSNVIPSPVLSGDLVVCMSGYRGSSALAIPLDATGDVTGTDRIAWQYTRDTPYVPSPLLLGDRLYFTKSNSAILTCLNSKTGETLLAPTRLPGLSNVYSSPVAAAGRVYITARDGTTLVLKAGDSLEPLATNRIDEHVDASPALVGKQLLLRGQEHLYCFEEAGSADSASK